MEQAKTFRVLGSRKQWGKHFRELERKVIFRLVIRELRNLSPTLSVIVGPQQCIRSLYLFYSL